MHEDLLAFRGHYPILDRRTYLVSHSLGAMHRGAQEGMSAYLDSWATGGVSAWYDWIPELAYVADLVGGLIGAPSGATVMRANVAVAIGDVASAIDFTGTRNKVVYSELEWPGSHYLWREHQRYGARPVVVPGEPDGVHLDVGRLVDEIDEHTAIVPISHVLFRTSTLIDVQPVVARAHEVGALVLLDCYQSAGTVPVDVTALDVDFAVGGSVKFLCGGPGNGFLYVAPRIADTLHPARVGWFGHADPFGFVFDDVQYAGGTMRFTGGTPNVPAAFIAASSYTTLAKIGIPRIRERSQSLTQQLVDGAQERGFIVRSPLDSAQRGGHVTIDPGDAQHVHDELHARGFSVDHRPGVGIRVGPHFYNTAEECVAVLDAMAEIRGH
ncbi:MAG: aminotransferase class V-fold PLP-dependent enzyme [Actinomycetes bacterium]